MLIAIADTARVQLIVVIDDDELVLDSMRRLLQGWGCRVVAAKSDSAALASLADHDRQPDLIISDYQLADGRTGFEAIERPAQRAGRSNPCFPHEWGHRPGTPPRGQRERLPPAHKPIGPATLRATLNHFLRDPHAIAAQRPEDDLSRCAD